MIDFYIVDVFAQQKFTGNQVAVLKSDSPLANEEMLKIAKEMKFIQSCFLIKNNDSYQVRIFMPKLEIPFSGDPVLASAFIINQIINEAPKESILIKLQKGDVEIQHQDDTYWMESPQPIFGRIFDKILLSRVLSIEPEDICDNPPIQQVSIGVPYIIVPIKNMKTLREISINKERYEWLTQRTKASCVLAYCNESIDEGNDYHIRVFADALGIPEDPASGSGVGSLAAYLSRYISSAEEGFQIRVEQGYEIGRPSLIKAKIHQLTEFLQIAIGGKVKLTSQGKIL
ncbi:hypothetical protein NEF87_003859 [Candidatus Lokiarchaeum ossiferum]|uniref:PhzF family phenazine biosynthesis protein n=1 Tax=Candidatus Lokiarchaeum ossiferum TaxID=2951803 RepID=A0ABY6HVN8_9ARCH|nr:hypothetical protein NEF87_003859 [Candidatus Lokiarchaeum sp. B-35]